MTLYREENRDRFWKEFGERVAKARVALNLSEEQAASDFGVSAHTLRRWEAGERSRPTHFGLGKFCEKYDVSLDWLYAGDNRLAPMFAPKTIGNVVPFPTWKTRRPATVIASDGESA